MKTNKTVSGSTVTNVFNFIYDANGNMIGKFAESTKPSQPGDSPSVGIYLLEDSPMAATVYTYDSRNRLLEVEEVQTIVSNAYKITVILLLTIQRIE